MSYYNIILKKIFENKFKFIIITFTITAITLVLSIFLTILLNFLSNTEIKNKDFEDNNSFYMNIDSRIDNIDQRIKELEENEHISKMQINYTNDFLVESINNVEMLSNVELTVINENTLVKDKNGNKIDNIKDNEVYLSYNLLKQLSFTEEILGKELLISNKNDEETKIIAGFFNSIIPSENIIIRDKDYNLNKVDTITIEIDKLSNVKEVQAHLRELDITNDIDMDDMLELLKVISITKISITVLVFLLILGFGYIIKIFISTQINSKKQFFALMKSFGYSSLKILEIVFIEFLLMIIISIILGFVSYIFIIKTLSSKINIGFIFDENRDVIFKTNYNAWLISIVTVISISGIIILLSKRKIDNHNVIDILKS